MADARPPATGTVAPGEVRIRRALLSVSDKRGLVEFARGLADLWVEIVSTGGTARELAEQGLETRPVEDYTGFPEILGGPFIRRFEGRIVNVHPSLLPAFPGVDAIGQALEYGVKVMGVTVHFVDEGVDSGPVIAQEAFAPAGADADAIAEQVHAIEHRLLPDAVRAIAAGRVRPDAAHPRRIDIDT